MGDIVKKRGGKELSEKKREERGREDCQRRGGKKRGKNDRRRGEKGRELLEKGGGARKQSGIVCRLFASFLCIPTCKLFTQTHLHCSAEEEQECVQEKVPCLLAFLCHFFGGKEVYLL